MKRALEYMENEARRTECMQNAINCYAHGFYETAMLYQFEYYLANDERHALLPLLNKRDQNFIVRSRNHIMYGKE